MGSAAPDMGRVGETEGRNLWRWQQTEGRGGMREKGTSVPGWVPRGPGLICWGGWVCATGCSLIVADRRGLPMGLIRAHEYSAECPILSSRAQSQSNRRGSEGGSTMNNLPPLPSLCFKNTTGAHSHLCFPLLGIQGPALESDGTFRSVGDAPMLLPTLTCILDPITEPRPSWHLSQAEIM